MPIFGTPVGVLPIRMYEDDDGNCEHSEICSDCGVVKRPSTCIMNNTSRDIDDLNEDHFCPGCRCDALTYIINDRS